MPVDLTLKKAESRLLVQAANSVPHHRCEPFMAVCKQLFERDLDELYVQRIDENTVQLEASGLGLLLVKKDYCDGLSFEFRFDEDETVQVTVTAVLDLR
jgi:hypothetical protein